MINQEVITEILADGRVRTSSGFVRYCQGDVERRVGDLVTVVGDTIIGWRRRTMPPPSKIEEKSYHFADASALKMYYVDTEFEDVIDEEEIKRPTEDDDSTAVLILHCYNDDTEYLVWFIVPEETGGFARCIIQQDSETVADFASVFPGVPEHCDAYIDELGSLIWVAGINVFDGTQTWIVAKYALGTVLESVIYTADRCAEIAKTYIAGKTAAAVENAVVEIENTEITTEVITGAQARGGYFGINYELAYAGSAPMEEWSASDAYYFGEYVFDLWNLDVFLSITGSGRGANGLTLNILSRNWSGTETTNQTNIPAPVIGNNSRFVYSAKTKTIVAEYSAPWQEVATIVETSIPRSVVATSVYAGDSTFTGRATGGTASEFFVSINVPAGIRFTDPAHCIVTFTTGANSGDSRIVAGSNLSNMVITKLVFTTPWDYAPASGDQFNIEVAMGTGTTVTQTMRYTATCTQETITTNAAVPTMLDIGGGYTIQTALSQISVATQNLYPVPKIKYSGATIYELDSIGASHYAGDGAWRTDTAELQGVVDGTALAVSGETVTEIPSPFNPTAIVTKRFV